jgi:aspartate-semialdehyde dehydrogenase
MAEETRKILSPTSPSCHLRPVPVFIGHAEAVHVEFEEPITEADGPLGPAGGAGGDRAGSREDGGYATQAETAGEDAVYVSRLRRDLTVPNGLASGASATTSAGRGAECGADRGGAGGAGVAGRLGGCGRAIRG